MKKLKLKRNKRMKPAMSLAYGEFLEQLQSGAYTDEQLYDYLVQHVGKDEKGYFIDSDGFYFLAEALRKIRKEKIDRLEHFMKKVLDDVMEYCPNFCESDAVELDCPDTTSVSCNFADYYHDARKLLGLDKDTDK